MLDTIKRSTRKGLRLYGISIVVAFPALLTLIRKRSRSTIQDEDDVVLDTAIALAFAPAWPWILCAEAMEHNDRRRRHR